MARTHRIPGVGRSRRARRQRAAMIVRAKRRARAWAPWITAGAAGSAFVGAAIAHRERIARAIKRLPGRTRGLVYRARGGRPRPDVGDEVLVERIRSTLGPLEKKLDVPRVHVMSTKGLAILHGSVGTQAEKSALEVAVSRVVGVKGVESHLHVGLSTADTRPSEGRRRMRALRIGRIGTRDRERAEAR